MDKQGLLLCAKYSVAPNFFGYCGPDENSSLLDHLKENVADKEVKSVLSEFETLHLNLKLIAFENKIKDPFDKKVVEAYWIGNPLLHNIKSKDYIALLKEKFALDKKIGEDKFGKLKFKFMRSQLLPHHCFHVFNIFKRTGNVVARHSLETMDNCRIGWGKIIKSANNPLRREASKLQMSNQIQVETNLLTVSNHKLSLWKKTIKNLLVDYKGKSFLKNVGVGTWVSFHWGFVCDMLDSRQVRNLEFYTQKAIDFYNQ